MSPIQQKPILHGRDHAEGGADPIPGLDGGGGSGAQFFGQRIGTTEDRWYSAGTVLRGTPGTNLSVADRMELFPFITSKDMTLDRIAIQVTSAISGNARLGMYTDDGNIYPDEFLFDAGTVSLGSTGPKVVTISQALDGDTLYWLGVAFDISSVQLRCWQPSDMMPILGHAPFSGTTAPENAIGWWFTHSAAGAFPDPFAAGATVFAAIHGNPTAISVRGT